MFASLQQRPGAVIFAAALLVRLCFLAFVEQPPVQFDARQYTAVAAVAPLAVTHPSLWNDSTARDNISFTRVLNDLIDDEDVNWTPYDPPTYGQALDWLFFSGPAYPAFLSAVYNLAPAHDFWVVRILQAVLDSLTALLIWLIMRRLASERGGLVAASLWIVYGPAIMKTGELLTETMSVFLVVAMVWALLRAHDTQSRRWLAAAGALCSILAMAKASTALLIVPTAAAWLWTNRKSSIRPHLGIALFAGSWLLVILPWLFLVNHRFGTFAMRDPSYGNANFRQANIVETEGYNVDVASFDFWTYPVWREITEHPIEHARLYLQKFRRLWWRACDDYRLGFPFGNTGTQWLHKLIVLFAAVGVCLWTRRAGPAAWMAIAVILYFAGLHTVMHAISRYNLLAMPFVIGAAVTGAFWIGDNERPRFLKRLGIVIGIIAVAAVVVATMRPTSWLLIPGMSVSPARVLYWITASGVVLAAVFLALSVRKCTKLTHFALTAAVGGLITMVFLGWATTREAYAEWAEFIDEPGIEVSREIEIPPGIPLQDVVEVDFLVDGVISRDANFGIALEIDHLRSVITDSLLIAEESFYPKPQYRAFMKLNGDKRAGVRCWSRNLVDGPLIDSILGDGVVRVALSIVGDPRTSGFLTVYGDLPQDDPASFVGPSLQASSIERYYEGVDPRLWEKLTIEESRSASVLRKSGQTDSNDLSRCLGRQTGQYRILLRLLLADQSLLYF